MTGLEPAGFPHSGTTGSQPACGSPMLFAAYRALRRLSVPRHPPCALIRLTGLCFDPPEHWAQMAHFLTEPLSHFRCSLTPFPLTQVVKSSDNTNCECALERERSALEDFRCPRAVTRRSRKEVIQPQVPLRLPCYDFAPVIGLAFGRWLPCGLPHGLRALPTSMA